jgi:hypothetical protein
MSYARRETCVASVDRVRSIVVNGEKAKEAKGTDIIIT